MSNSDIASASPSSLPSWRGGGAHFVQDRRQVAAGGSVRKHDAHGLSIAGPASQAVQHNRRGLVVKDGLLNRNPTRIDSASLTPFGRFWVNDAKPLANVSLPNRVNAFEQNIEYAKFAFMFRIS